ncbi:hypothetical protein [Spiroplasma sp. AdecLV25b]|uniref:hypothetical protein n=1 Tax=Spiroplasma sp. AdecLV25b TaxID=3027162 RepID=UPI0027E04D93|nr:hypothetical protein [Spiroplasma sp. AdecLV25b]
MNKEIKEVKCSKEKSFYKDKEKWFINCLGYNIGISISCLCDVHLMCNACCEECFSDNYE